MSFLKRRATGPSRASLAFIAVTVALDVASQSMIFPILPRLVEQLADYDRASAARWVGWLEAAWAITQFFAAPVLGLLSDRFGRRPVILISLFGLAVDLIATAITPNLWWLLLARGVCGMTTATPAAAAAYVADVTPPAQRAGTFGLLNAAAWTGIIVGPAIGGLAGAHDPRLPFWIAAGVTAVNAIYGLFVLPESLSRERRTTRLAWRKANPVGAVGLLASRAGLLPLAGVFLLLWFALHAMNSVFVLYTLHRYGWDPMAFGVFCSVLAVGNIVVQSWLAGRASRRFGDRATLLAGLGFQVVGFLVAGLAPTTAWFWAANAITVLGNLAGPALQSLMSAKVGEDEQGRLQGACGAMASTATFFGPVAFTQVFAWSLVMGTGWLGVTLLAGAGLTLIALVIAGLVRDG